MLQAFAALLALHAAVRGGEPRTEIANVDVASANEMQHVAWSALSHTKLAPGAVTVRASAIVQGDHAGIEIPTCSHRGAVTIDGTRYAPPEGPFVVRVAPRAEPHTIAIEITVSEYEKRVACGDAIRAGNVVDVRDGTVAIDFASPEIARGGGRAVVYVPPNHDVTKPSALVVGVHPWNGNAWTYAAYAELLAAARANDIVLVMPSGLGNSLYTAGPEEETMRAIAAVSGAIAIDPKRVSIWGASMGGQGACTIGLHHPDRFAFIASYFGDARFNINSYVRSILPTPEAAHRVNPIDVIDNARHVPILLIHGDADQTSSVRESDELAAALRQRGYTHQYDRVPGRGHEGLLVVDYIADVIARAARAQVPANPARVTFRSVRAGDDRAYGVRIVRESQTADAFVDVEQIAGRVVVHAATGVRAIMLDAGALGAQTNAQVAWDSPHKNIELHW